jgi:hypothetical protein
LGGIRENPLTRPKLRRPFKSTPYHAITANFGTSIAEATTVELLPRREWSSTTRRCSKGATAGCERSLVCFAEIIGGEYGTRN